MSRSKDRAGEPEGDKPSTTNKRKALVAPGYLRGLLQARQRMKSMGLTAADGAGSSGSGAAPHAAPRRPGGREQLFVPSATLPLLFAQRKKFLQSSKLKGTPQPYRLNEELPVGLLSLPEDVLLKIVCLLGHNEIRPLFQVCKQLNTTLRTAVHFHFNYATPFRQADEQGPPLPRPDRNKKRAVTNLAAVLSHLTRSGRLTVEARAASGHTTAPRALTFADNSNASRREGGGGVGGRIPALA